MRDARVGHVSALPGDHASGPIGGVGAYTGSLLGILAAGAFDHTLVANRDAGRSEIAALPENVCVLPTWRFGDPLAFHRIARALEGVRPAIVHVQHELFLYGSSARALLFPPFLHAMARRRPTVVTVHGVTTSREIDESLLAGRRSPLPLGLVRPIIVGIFRSLARSNAELVVHSETLRARLIALGAAATKVHVIAHPLFTARAAAVPTIDRRTARARLGIPQDAEVVLTWGYWNGYKGLEVLAAGFADFAATRPNALLVLGTGPHPQHRNDQAYLHAYRTAAAALEGAGRRHVGFIADETLPDYLAAADVCVFAYTKHLAASGPATFALSAGKPILLSTVFPGVPATLTFTPEPNAVARALARFFDDPASHARAALALRENASDDRVRTAYDDLYARVLAKTSS